MMRNHRGGHGKGMILCAPGPKGRPRQGRWPTPTDLRLSLPSLLLVTACGLASPLVESQPWFGDSDRETTFAVATLWQANLRQAQNFSDQTFLQTTGTRYLNLFGDWQAHLSVTMADGDLTGGYTGDRSDVDSSTATVNLRYEIREGHQIGGVFALAKDRYRTPADTFNVTDNTTHAGLYSHHRLHRWYATASLYYGWSRLKTASLEEPVVTRTKTSRAETLSAALQTGYDWLTPSPLWRLGPLVSLDLTSTDVDDELATEALGGQPPLDSKRLGAGLFAHYLTPYKRLSLHAALTWRCEYAGEFPTVAGVPGEQQILPERTRLTSMDLTYAATPLSRISIQYRHESGYLSSQTLTVGGLYNF